MLPDRFLTMAFYRDLILQIQQWTLTNVFVMKNFLFLALQTGLLLIARALGEILGRWLRRLIQARLRDHGLGRYRLVSALTDRLMELIPLVSSTFILWTCTKAMDGFGYPAFLMRLVLNLSVAWVIIQVATSVIYDRFWRRLAAAFAWVCAALNIVGLLDETVSLLEAIGFSLGSVRLNLLSIIKATLLLLVLLKLVKLLSEALTRNLEKVPDFSPSTRLMIAKSIHLVMLFFAAVIALNSVGIDLTALAVFSGAVGVGVGFGLQKVVANFVSGLILLYDKSVKPGDVVEIDSVYGWVNHMGGRYVSVVTRDEKEYLIPNEDLITGQVVNWSYSSSRIRVKADVGISYTADPHEAIRLITGCVKGIGRILEDPEPRCLLMGFGDSSVNLQLRFWIRDPRNGVANVTSEVLLRIWDTLKANGMEIPFPQRDVHLFVKKQDPG